MKWIKCSDELPVQCPVYGPQVAHPTYDWVLVSPGDSRFTIARYGHVRINGKLIPAWEFYDTDMDTTECPYAGDATRPMSIDEIKYWMWIDEPENPDE